MMSRPGTNSGVQRNVPLRCTEALARSWAGPVRHAIFEHTRLSRTDDKDDVVSRRSANIPANRSAHAFCGLRKSILLEEGRRRQQDGSRCRRDIKGFAGSAMLGCYLGFTSICHPQEGRTPYFS
jgi:hypothetical protein